MKWETERENQLCKNATHFILSYANVLASLFVLDKWNNAVISDDTFPSIQLIIDYNIRV